MLSKLRSFRPSHTTVVAYLGLFIALGTGTAYAANTVFSTDIVDGQVKSVDLGDTAVLERKLADGAVTSGKFRDNNLAGVDVKDNSLKGADIDEGSLVGRVGSPLVFASVNGTTGEANYGRGVVNSERTGLGNYLVTFNRSLVRCVAVATVGTGNPATGGDTFQRGTSAMTRIISGSLVAVDTARSPLDPADLSFQLAVFC